MAHRSLEAMKKPGTISDRVLIAGFPECGLEGLPYPLRYRTFPAAQCLPVAVGESRE